MPLKKEHYAELLTPRADGPSYESVAQRAVNGKLLGLPILIASAQSLIELKELAIASADATMQKHQCDIESLRPHV